VEAVELVFAHDGRVRYGLWRPVPPGSIRRSPVECSRRTGTPPYQAIPPLADLTPKEREVLALIGAGLSNIEIARSLFVSEGTMKTHVNHLFAKLGLRDRAAAIVLAHDQDLVRRPRT